MEPAAILAVVVKARGVAATNAELRTVQGTLEKTEAASVAMGRGMVSAGKKTTAAGKFMTKGVTTPLLAIAAASTAMSLKFNRDMSLIQTQAGASAKETAYLKKEVLGLSEASKFGPDEVAEALFRVRSAGFKGAKGLAVLKRGMQLATLGNSNLEMTTKALTGAAKSLDLEGSKAMKHLAAEMNATVGTGDMRMEELQDALSTGVLPAFVQAGMGMRDYASALTVMTDRNVPAQVASTRLRTAITMLIPHSKKAEEALEGVGIKSEDLATIMRSKGLPAAIEFLAKHLDSLSKNKQNRIMIEAFGGAKSSATIEMLVQNWQELFEKQKLVGEGIGKYNHQLKVAEENPLVELQKAWSTIQVALVKIGEVIVPIVVPAFIKVAHVIGHVVDAFAKLPPGTQKSIVYIGFLVAAIGPLLTLFGFMMRKSGELILWLERNNMALGSNAAMAEEATVANSELAVSYDAVAASAEAAAAAQATAAADAKIGQMSMLMPSAGAGGQLSLLGTTPMAAAAPAEAAVGAEAGAAGGVAAGGFASGLASMLPAALAAAGVINILSSVLGGDSKGALFKVGGAAAGAIAGGLIGGLPGALIGGGLGSILGGFIGKLFGGHVARPMQDEMMAQAQHARDAAKSQRAAADELVQAEDQVTQANKRHHQSTRRVTQAHRELNHAIKQFGPSSHQAREAELALAHAQHRDAQTAHEAKRAHQLAGNALKLYRHETTITIAAEKQRLPSLDAQIKHMSHKYESEEHNYALLRRLVKKENVAAEVRRNISKTVAEAGEKAGHKFAAGLQKMTPVQATLGKHLHGLENRFNSLPKVTQNSTQQMVHDFTHMGDIFGQKTKTATEDSRTWYRETNHGVVLVKGNLSKFAKELGISKAEFHSSITGGGKKGKGHQLGGMVVPGGGTGDKVPLTAMVEPGEIVHVLNSRASKDRKKLGALEHINQEVPRFPHRKFAEGGNMAAAMATASNIDSQHFPYVWGGGHGGFSGPYDCSGAVSAVLHAGGWLDKPMVSGELANFGAAGPGPITIYANAVHTFMKIAGKFFGTSGSNPGGGAGFFPTSVGEGEANEGDSGGKFQVRHPTGAVMAALAKVAFSGPPGELGSTGAKSVGDAQAAAEKWAKAHTPGQWGGGDAALMGPGRIVGASTYGGPADHVSGTVGASGVSLPGKMAFAELMMGKALGDLPFGAKLRISRGGKSVIGEKLDIGLGGGAVDGHSRDIDLWYQTAEALGLPNAWLGLVKVQNMQKAMQGGLLGMASGGSTKDGKTKAKQDPIAKSIGNVLQGLRAGKHLPKYQGKLAKLKRHIDAIGLNDKQLGRLQTLEDMTGDVSKYEEFASNASTLTTESEEGVVNQGKFKGRTEGEWLNEQLGALLRLRSRVAGEYGIEAPELPKLKKLLKEANQRLHAVKKAIREAEKKKQEIEKQVKEIERAQKESKTKLEKELGEVEHRLSAAEKAKNPNKGELATLRGEVHAKKEAISGNDKHAQEEIHKLNDQVHRIEGEQKDRHRVESALTGTIIPSLTGKKESVAQLLEGIKGEAGEVEGRGQHISFSGLQLIQGAGGSLGDIGNPPPIGTVGGEIFTVQNRLREIQEDAEKASGVGASGESESESEAKQIAEQLAEEWRKRYLVSQSQYAVLSAMPSVSAIAAPAAPYAGAYAKGGVVMAEVGEKGREVVAVPQGSRVIPSHEAQAALKEGGDINFEHVEFHEAEQKVVGRANGKPFEKDVRRVTRKDTLKSMSRTPGGRGIR
jgi:TP901 family phage tail tape measure protein